MQSPAPQTREYPVIQDRYKAFFTDGLSLILIAYTGLQVVESLETVPPVSEATLGTLLFVLYEPLMVASVGGTIGHYALSLRVRDAEDDERRLPLYRAFMRFGMKFLFGTFTLFTISSDERSQALHDKVADAVMIKV